MCAGCADSSQRAPSQAMTWHSLTVSVCYPLCPDTSPAHIPVATLGRLLHRQQYACSSRPAVWLCWLGPHACEPIAPACCALGVLLLMTASLLCWHADLLLVITWAVQTCMSRCWSHTRRMTRLPHSKTGWSKVTIMDPCLSLLAATSFVHIAARFHRASIWLGWATYAVLQWCTRWIVCHENLHTRCRFCSTTFLLIHAASIYWKTDQRCPLFVFNTELLNGVDCVGQSCHRGSTSLTISLGLPCRSDGCCVQGLPEEHVLWHRTGCCRNKPVGGKLGDADPPQ